MPVQQLSDAMKGTNQCSFNLDLDKNTLEVIDPFNLFDCDVNKFNLEEPRTKRQGGKKISEIRKSKKITQSELAERTGLTQNHISRIENGEYSPRLDIASKIADALGCKVDDFLKAD